MERDKSGKLVHTGCNCSPPKFDNAGTLCLPVAVQVFKSKFSGWDDVIAVDFTRTAESVRRTGADIGAWAKKQQTKTDLSALFTPRQVRWAGGGGLP